MEKQKMKDLELTYGGKENRIRLRFKGVEPGQFRDPSVSRRLPA